MILILLLAAQLALADHYEQGMELARKGSWSEARKELLAGNAESPRDKRFLLELAGVEYRLGDRGGARKYLQKALDLDPADFYANDFLGTLFFLDGNAEAALTHWNRIGKPRIQNIEISPRSRIRPELLDRALAFAPGDVLTVNRYQLTMDWMRGLDTFEGLRLDLQAREDGFFDATFRWQELPGWVNAAQVLAGVPFQILEFRQHLGEAGVTLAALYRFDAQRRRAGLTFSSPLNLNPKIRYSIFTDARSETWNIDQPADFRVRRIAAGAAMRFMPFARFSWETGATLADRSFPGAPQFVSGSSIAHSISFRYQFLNVPDRRLTADFRGAWETGRLFDRTSGGLFARTEWSVRGQWFPKPRGTDYQLVVRLSTGAVMGKAPLDELFMLTYDRDYDLPLRGHDSAVNDKRGSAPIGRRYVLANVDFYKRVWHPSLVTVDIGPLLDTGRVWDQIAPRERGKVLVDAGAQLRLGLPGGFQVIVSYARDLRGGAGVFDSFTR